MNTKHDTDKLEFALYKGQIKYYDKAVCSLLGTFMFIQSCE